MNYPGIRSLSVLYADDNPFTREMVIDYLADIVRVRAVIAAPSGGSAAGLYFQIQPDVVISNLSSPFWQGLDLVQTIRNKNSSIPVIFITDIRNKPAALQLLNLKGIEFIEKPLLLRRIYAALLHSIPANCGRPAHIKQP
jgi:two-component system C4-dicarboxylate transport response regulator DctD